MAASTATGASSDMVILNCQMTKTMISSHHQQLTVRELYRESRFFAKLKIEPNVQFNNLPSLNRKYPSPAYGLLMVACNGRVIVKSHQLRAADEYPKIGSTIVALRWTCDHVSVLAILVLVCTTVSNISPMHHVLIYYMSSQCFSFFVYFNMLSYGVPFHKVLN